MRTRNIIKICSVCLILVLFSVQGVFSFSVSTVNEDRLYIDNTAKENESVSERHLDNPDGLSFNNLMNQVGDFLSPSIWLSDDPEDLKPLIDTEWEFTFTIISTFTDTITFGSNIESTSDGTVGLQCTNQYGSRGYVFYGDLPTGGTGYSTVIEGYLLIEFYLFNISGNSATGKYMHKNKSTGRYSNVYNMTGIKTRGGKPEQPPVISEIEDVTIEAGIPWNSPAPDIISGTTPVTWSLEKGPSGMTINSSKGVVSWNNPVDGKHIITIRAQNNAGHDDASWLLTVFSQPVINEVADLTIIEGSPFVSSEPELISGTQPVTWSLEKGPSGMTINSLTGSVSWNNPVEGDHIIVIKAQNSTGYDEVTWLLTVLALPVINNIADVTINEGAPWNSPAPDLISGTPPVTWLLVEGPDGMTIDSSTGAVYWEYPVEGVYTITIKAENAAGAQESTWLLIVEKDPVSCAASYLMGDDYPGLNSLRLFRDNILSKNNAGILLIAIYYDKSSNVIEICEEYPFLKPLFRKVIEAVIPVVNLIAEEGS